MSLRESEDSKMHSILQQTLKDEDNCDERVETSEDENNNSNNNNNYNHDQSAYEDRQPDADALKMFVGQLPRDWGEAECRQLFGQFGDVFSINILKDKTTKKSQGCCFVTFYTRKAALEAQNALHNLRKLPTCRNPIQMKPADNENKNDRKLFIGKVPKSIKETEIVSAFAPFGTIEECIILRDAATGVSKGCAFVTYTSRSMAMAAIKATHQTKLLEGCQQPLVVKFADQGTPKKPTPTNGNVFSGTGINNNTTTNLVVNAALASQLYGPSMATLPVASYSPALLDSINYLNLLKTQQQHQQAQHAQQLEQAAAAAAAAAAAVNVPPVMPSAMFPFVYNLGTSASAAEVGYSSASSAALLGSSSSPPSLNGSKLSSLFVSGSPLLSTSAASQYLTTAAAFPATSAASPSPFTASLLNKLSCRQTLATDASPSAISPSKQMEGPDGANLFIYHLPVEYGDEDLVSLFSSFGTILSAKVFIDKNSNLSKCFGFVSFESVESAQAAIRTMNGFQVLNKRLKVQPKKTRDKPY